MAHALPKLMGGTVTAQVSFDYQGPAIFATVRFRVIDLFNNAHEFETTWIIPESSTPASQSGTLTMTLAYPPLVWDGLLDAEVLVLDGIFEKVRDIHSNAYLVSLFVSL